jgi:Tfp pilus assembly protein PilO
MAFDLNKLSKREKVMVGVLLLAISTVPFFQFTMPAWNKYNESNTKIKELQNKLFETGSKIKKLEKLKFENQKILKKVEEQKVYLAKSYEIDFLVQDLKKICDESLISLESFTPTNSEPVNIVLEKQLEADSAGPQRSKLKETLEKLKGQDLPIDLYRFPVEVRVTGDFSEILELLKKLETYGRVISVENISIGKIQAKDFGGGNRLSKSKSKKKPDAGSLLSTFDLVAYSLPLGEEKIPVKQLQKSLTSKSKFSIKKSNR